MNRGDDRRVAALDKLYQGRSNLVAATALVATLVAAGRLACREADKARAAFSPSRGSAYGLGSVAS